MNKPPYSKQLIVQFVREWEAAKPGPESFEDVISKYPEEFRRVWREVTGKPGVSWKSAEEGMIQELCTNRTKLGRALK